MATNDSNVIYLEVDEDITSAIDKLTKAEGESIQVVTAKRSTLFQSVINMRLLKKAADDGKKQLVLVTNDRVSTNLAGRIGVSVATQVGGAAEVPKSTAPGAAAAAATGGVADDEIDGGTIGDTEPKESAPTPPPLAPEKIDEPAPKAEPVAAAAAAPLAKAASTESAAPKSKKKSPVPNIGSMQKRILWIGGGLLAIILLFAANYYFTTAKVTLFAKGTQKPTTFSLTVDPSGSGSQPSSGVLAATQLSETKTLSSTVTATGTKDNGTKASGSITVYNKYDSAPHQLVAGTRFMSPDGKIFRSTADTTVPGGSLCGGGICAGQTKVNVEAESNGDQYNVGPAKYTIPGLSADQQAGIYGQGDQMSGGTSKTVKVITQGDMDKAKQAAIDGNNDDAQKDLLSKAGSGMVVLKESIQQNVTKVTSNPDVNAEASSGSVSVEIAYTALAVKKSELSDLVKSQEQAQVGEDQEIYDDGSDNLALTLAGKPTSTGAMKFSAKAVASIGKKIDKDQLAKDLKGKKAGEAQDIAGRLQDVDHAEVNVKPGWATSLPQITKHIHIEIKVAS